MMRLLKLYLNIPLGTVKSRLNVAVKNLRREMLGGL